MNHYDKEKWLELYASAMLELKRAKIAGRIGSARTEIAARIQKLQGIPGLHANEDQALEDALTGLRSLELIEERDAKRDRRIAETAMERLRVIAPRLENLG